MKQIAKAATLVVFTSVTALSSASVGDWCEEFADIGKVYSSKKNPYLQKLTFSGRAHYQQAHTDAEFTLFGIPNSFHENGEYLRRLRFGMEAEFLNGFELEAGVRLAQGEFRNPSIGFLEMDYLALGYDFGDLGAFEDVTLTYGRMKYALTGEWHTSTNKIKTVERSNISNAFGFSRATGAMLEATWGTADLALGILTTDIDEVWGQWNGRTAYYASAAIDLGKDKDLILDVLYSDSIGDQDNDIFEYEWVTSATYDMGIGEKFDLFTNAIYGQAERGKTYGIVVIPSYQLIEDRLELVARYQWARNTASQFQTNRRAIRDVAATQVPVPPVARGQGSRWEENQSVYLGANFHLCEDGATLLIGAEWEESTRRFAKLESTTLWGAFRVFF